MKRFHFLPTIIATLLCLTGCADTYGDFTSDIYIEHNSQQMSTSSYFMYLLRVEKADGSNIFADANPLLSVPNVSASICIIRESDQAQMTLEPAIRSDDDLWHDLICVAWNDMDLRSTKNRPDIYDDAYTTKLGIYYQGISEQHEVRLNIHAEGKLHRITSYEVDGQIVTPTKLDNGDPMICVKLNDE